MPQALPLPPPGFEDWAFEEKLDYVQALWDSIANRPEDVPVPEWHQRILEERLASHRADPGAARPWEQVRAELAAKLRRQRLRKG